MSGDPATGKSFRCVQNKNQGFEGLFYAAWGMEGSYHPQGRSKLLTHDPTLKEGNVGDEAGTSPCTAFVKPKGRLGKSKRETFDKRNILFAFNKFSCGVFIKEKNSQKSNQFYIMTILLN